MNMTKEIAGNINQNMASELNDRRSSVRSIVPVALALWFGLVFLLGAQGAFIGRAGSPPLPIFIGFAIPLVVFFVAYFGWDAFRAMVLAGSESRKFKSLITTPIRASSRPTSICSRLRKG